MQSENRIVVNGFELAEPVGRGGMGVVWRARHLGEGIDVALKFVTSEFTDDPEYREGFRREVEAAAGLSHLGIVTVHDSGTVDELVSLASNGELPTGSPWLAMEFARYGNLADVVIESWSELRVVLYDVLDALAHAHSRGVIHRDLKPANILAAEAADGELILKLSDFGIAHVSSRKGAREDHEVMGTPAFMAPEQYLGRSRDYGPWTDLYALGCVAWEMVTGAPPFVGNVFAMLDAHVNRPPPALEPEFQLPDGFDRWLGRLLKKRPGARFRHAADARHALSQLDPVEDEAEQRSVRVGQLRRTGASSSPATASAQTLPLMLPADTIRDISPDSTSLQMATGAPDHHDAPPIPRTWRVAGRVAPSRTLLSGVGLGLFGLRPIPFVGRRYERDVIWRALRAVKRNRRPRAVVIEGEAGCGKSRLAEWVGQRAAELGAAQLLVATHDPMTGGSRPVREMVSRALRCDGLDRTAAYARIHRRLGGTVEQRESAAVLAELCVPDHGADDGPNVQFDSVAERHAAVRRALEVFTRERPVIVWLDDVQWGADAIAMLLAALAADWSEPVLFVVTARSESLDERRRESALFDRLRDHERVETLSLDRLQPEERTEQIQRMLRLPDQVVEDVAKRSEGNPLFAVQLVGDWVQRGVLERTATGFELADDTSGVPDDIHSLWMRRFHDVEGRFGEEGGVALKVAAALGQEVGEHEWRRACETIRVSIPHALTESLVSRRLGRRTAERRGFAFAHGMFRESIVRACREDGTWTRMNSACAAALELLYPKTPPAIAVRRARHLLAAREPERAVDLLLVAARESLNLEQTNDAERALELAEQAIEEANLAEHDERRGRFTAWNNELHRIRGAFDASDAELKAFLKRSRKYGWREPEAHALWHLGTTTALYQDAAHGRELLFRAAELFEEVTGESRRAEALKYLSHVYGLKGDAERARRYGVKAHELFRRQKKYGEMAWCLYYVALAERIAGDSAEALRRLTDALERARDAGLRDLQANCLNGCGDAHRLLDDLDAARQSYDAAIELWDSMGSSNVEAARFNLAMCELQADEFERAEEVLSRLIDEFRERAQKIPLAASHVAMITCAAARGDSGAARTHIDAARPLLEETGLVDPDLLFAEERARELFAERGMYDLVATMDEMLEMQR